MIGWPVDLEKQKIYPPHSPVWVQAGAGLGKKRKNALHINAMIPLKFQFQTHNF